MQDNNGKLEFNEGNVLRAVKDNKWLVIDEINRADINKAFGQLFTILSGQDVELAFKDGGGRYISMVVSDSYPSYFDANKSSYVIGKNWRIIATMNVYDMQYLYELSYAFMRRFAFVYLDNPSASDQANLIDTWGKGLSEPTRGKIQDIADLPERPLGPGIVKDMVTYVTERGSESSLAESIVAMVLPQLIGLEEPKVRTVWKNLGKVFEDKTVPNKKILPILRELVALDLDEVR